MVKDAYEVKETKDKGSYPAWARNFHDLFYAIEKDKKVRLITTVINFTAFIVMPNVYYGLVRGNLFRNF